MNSVVRTALMMNAGINGSKATYGPLMCGQKTLAVTVTGSGAVSATVVLRVGNNSGRLKQLASFSLAGTTSDTAILATDASWAYWELEVTALAGTGAAVYADIGEVP